MLAAVIQLSSQDDVARNLARATTLIGEAARAGAQLVALPENFAYMGDDDGKRSLAEKLDGKGPITNAIAAAARESSVHVVAGGMPELGEDLRRPYNSSVLFDPRGAIIAVYRKVHLFDVDLPDGTSLRESDATSPGHEAVVARVRDVPLGMTVCYDLRFPELYRALERRGARVVTVPSAFTLTTGKDHWHVLLRARAIENQAFVLAPAQHGKHPRGRQTYGKSLIVDPWGDVLAQCGEGEGFAVARLDLAYQDRVRASLPCLAHRRLDAAFRLTAVKVPVAVVVPFADLQAQHATIREEVMAAACEVIEAQAFVLGEPVARFERTLAAIAGVEHAVAVGSGTDALVLALRALDVGEGDTVILPSLTFVATAEAVVTVGARPIFVDVDPRTLTLAPSSVEARLVRARARGEKIRAVLPVHLFGHCADMAALGELARAHGAALVEDAAQAIGARDGAGVAGGMGQAGCFSFFPSKNLGAWGDGGAVTTNDRRLADRVRRLRQHGISGGEDDDGRAEPGINSRLDALQAAVLDVKARHLEQWTLARREVAARYRRLFEGIPHVEVPSERDGTRHVYHQFVLRTPRRDALAEHLRDRGVATRSYYARPVHRLPAYASYEALDLRETDAASRELLALPMYAELTESAQEHVAGAIRGFLAKS